MKIVYAPSPLPGELCEEALNALLALLLDARANTQDLVSLLLASAQKLVVGGADSYLTEPPNDGRIRQAIAEIAKHRK